MGAAMALGKQLIGDTGNSLGFGGNQTNLSGLGPSSQEVEFTNALMQQYMGQGGPSAAQLQMQQGLDTAQSNAMGVAAAQRGVSPGLAARQASQVQGQNAMQNNQAAGIMRAQEQQAAGNTLAGVFGSQRGTAAQRAGIESGADQKSYDRKMGAIKGIGSAMVGAMADGGVVEAPPGAQATVPGDSLKNDKIPKMLSEGEIVVPRSHAKDPEMAKEFIDQLMGSRGKMKDVKSKGEFDFGKLLKTQNEILARIKSLEGAGSDEVEDDEDAE